jgi:hypothetical protein
MVVVWPGPGYIGTIVCAELQRLHRVGLAMCRALHEPAGTFDRENGGGFLTDHFPCATKVSGFAALYHIRTWFNCCWTAALLQACLPHSTGCSFQPYTRSPAAHTSLSCTTRTTRLCTMDGVSADKRLGLLWAHHLEVVSHRCELTVKPILCCRPSGTLTVSTQHPGTSQVSSLQVGKPC